MNVNIEKKTGIKNLASKKSRTSSFYSSASRFHSAWTQERSLPRPEHDRQRKHWRDLLPDLEFER